MTENLAGVFNRAYEQALRGPTASTALTEATNAGRAAVCAEIVAKLEREREEYDQDNSTVYREGRTDGHMRAIDRAIALVREVANG